MCIDPQSCTNECVCAFARCEEAVEPFVVYRTYVASSKQKPNGRMYQSLGDMGNKKKFLLCSKKVVAS